MGFDEIKRKAQSALGDEQKTDEYLDKGADFINEKTGGKYSDKVQQGRDFLDDKIGDGDSTAAGEQGQQGSGSDQQDQGGQGQQGQQGSSNGR